MARRNIFLRLTSVNGKEVLFVPSMITLAPDSYLTIWESDNELDLLKVKYVESLPTLIKPSTTR